MKQKEKTFTDFKYLNKATKYCADKNNASELRKRIFSDRGAAIPNDRELPPFKWQFWLDHCIN